MGTRGMFFGAYVLAALFGIVVGLNGGVTGSEITTVSAQAGCDRGPSIALSGWTDYNCESCVTLNAHTYYWEDVYDPLVTYCEDPSNARYMQVEVETCVVWTNQNPPPTGYFRVYDQPFGTLLQQLTLFWIGDNLFTSNTTLCYEECNWPSWYVVFFDATTSYGEICLDRVRYRGGCCHCDPSQCPQ